MCPYCARDQFFKKNNSRNETTVYQRKSVHGARNTTRYIANQVEYYFCPSSSYIYVFVLCSTHRMIAFPFNSIRLVPFDGFLCFAMYSLRTHSIRRRRRRRRSCVDVMIYSHIIYGKLHVFLSLAHISSHPASHPADARPTCTYMYQPCSLAYESEKQK